MTASSTILRMDSMSSLPCVRPKIQSSEQCEHSVYIGRPLWQTMCVGNHASGVGEGLMKRWGHSQLPFAWQSWELSQWQEWSQKCGEKLTEAVVQILLPASPKGFVSVLIRTVAQKGTNS